MRTVILVALAFATIQAAGCFGPDVVCVTKSDRGQHSVECDSSRFNYTLTMDGGAAALLRQEESSWTNALTAARGSLSLEGAGSIDVQMFDGALEKVYEETVRSGAERAVLTAEGEPGEWTMKLTLNGFDGTFEASLIGTTP